MALDGRDQVACLLERRFARIENVIAIKIAPFNRYQTFDVVRAVVEAGRDDIALYTGNDDNILNDLCAVFDFNSQRLRFAGGLLGHWAVWTRVAVSHLAKARPAELFHQQRDPVGLGKRRVVVGDAGTVNTGAIDALEEIGDFCRRESLWFHVDGAYGAMARLSGRLAPLFAGMERADSIAADPHKWLYVPYEAGAALVREPGRLSATFRKFPEYLASDPESPFPGPAWFAERGVELSRSFKALKVWMGLKTHGRRGYARAIENDVDLAHFLAEEVDRRADFERLAPTVLSIANFRYRPAGLALSDEDLDRVNRKIVNRLVGDGSFFLAPTILKGRTALRVSITNFRTREEDLTALLDEAAGIGTELVNAAAP